MSELEQIGEEWSNIDIEINKLKKIMKDLNEKKKNLTNKLMEKMVINNKNEIQLKDCLITLKSIVKPAALKKEDIKESINKCINNINKSDEITEYIFNNKNFVKVNDLKKIKK